jgi:hypothetical protein
VSCNDYVPARLFAPLPIGASGDRHCNKVGGARANILKCYDDEAPPECGTFLRQERQRGPLRDFDFASTN